ncbi:toxin-antitoxin system TumE family protein [Brevibacillus centrosporus]|uniref:toxin-antitoxin system TumE family protein n=1 Tax=Brevibacillus centrosporus TaxID=54910 RepID=UPI003D256B30
MTIRLNDDPRPLSNIPQLQSDYADIIARIEDYNNEGKPSSMVALRKSIFFTDGTRLSVTERILNSAPYNSRYTDKYQYDWTTAHGEVILKFHNEKHDDPRYQTNSEPHHIHRSDQFSEDQREDNFLVRELHEVLFFIRLFQWTRIVL